MRRTVLAVITAVVLTGGGWLLAQQRPSQHGAPSIPPDIRAGVDLGFRVREMKDGRAIGTLVIRTKNGAWVEAHAGSTRGFVVPLESK